MTTNHVVDRTAILLLLVLCVFWGLQQVAIKLALDSVSPIMQAALRSIVAVFLLSLWMRWKGIGIFQKDGAEWWGILAGLLFTAEFALLYWSLEYTTASRAIVFLYMSPFVVASGMHWFVPSERFRLLQIISEHLLQVTSNVIKSSGRRRGPDFLWGGGGGITPTDRAD